MIVSTAKTVENLGMFINVVRSKNKAEIKLVCKRELLLIKPGIMKKLLIDK